MAGSRWGVDAEDIVHDTSNGDVGGRGGDGDRGEVEDMAPIAAENTSCVHHLRRSTTLRAYSNNCASE